MLKIYRSIEEVPKGVKCVLDNDDYFDAKSRLLNTDLVKEILWSIEQAEVITDSVFLSRNKKVGGLSKILLSTGTKTLINIINYPDVCFNLIECGMNILTKLPMLSLRVDGVVIWERCAYPFEDNFECDFYFNGKRFIRVFDFVEEVFNADN